ncbi:hypothetical protein D3C84_1174080 [compost metagenome]
MEQEIPRRVLIAFKLVVARLQTLPLLNGQIVLQVDSNRPDHERASFTLLQQLEHPLVLGCVELWPHGIRVQQHT